MLRGIFEIHRDLKIGTVKKEIERYARKHKARDTSCLSLHT